MTNPSDSTSSSTAESQPPKTIAISGATGLVGRSLVARLLSEGHTVRPLVRREPKDNRIEIQWDPESGEVNAAAFAEVDAVVHLAGENVGEGRWTDEKKQRIRDSRIEGTRLLCDAMVSGEKKPETLVCASAIGYYGDRGSVRVNENDKPGVGFLPKLCQDWEETTRIASDAGIRTVNLRIGVVLSPEGGALRKMLTPFRLGVGGVIGGGEQYMSWITVDDVVSAITHSLFRQELSGPVNAVAPQPATNYGFTKTLGRVLWRPTFLPLPAFAARLAFGEMADELLLSSTRVRPLRLKKTGFLFAHPELEPALRHLLQLS